MAPARPYYDHERLRTAAEAGPSRNDGSRTITIEDPSHGSDDEAGSSGEPDGVLRLRGGPIHTDPRVRWEDGTVDNEFLNRKKSKICCIYHKPRTRNMEDPFADSSSSSSDESSDTGEESEGSSCECEEQQDDEEARSVNKDGQSELNGVAAKQKRRKGKGKAITHSHHVSSETQCTHSHEDAADASNRIRPNAYEIQPRYGKFKRKKSKKASGSSTTVIQQPT